MNRSVILLLFLTVSAQAATVCVGPSATGNGSGADWNNQAQWSSVTLTRGNTYYLADGSYGGKTLSVAISGTTLISIKKAIVGDSAVTSIAGWVNTLGDGNAAFTGSITFSSSNWEFDGMKGGGWTGGAPDDTQSNYGFTFTDVALPLRMISGGTTISNFICKHVGAVAPTPDVEKSFCSTAGTSGSVHNGFVSYCYAYGFNSFQWLNSSDLDMNGWITEHNVQRDLYVTDAHHGEELHNSFGNVQYWHIRYNWIQGRRSGSIQPTMVIGALNNSAGPYYVYGNVFKDLNYADGGICAVDNGQGTHSLSGVVYNNTFDDLSPGNPAIATIGGDGNNSMDAQNNVFINMRVNENTTGTYSYNGYYNNSQTPAGESNKQTFGANPFTDSANDDYTLTAHTDTGVTLGAPYNQDAAGNIRGTGGVWDRGALQYAPAGSGSTLRATNATFNVLIIGTP
jgi:hypothetical protein